MGQAKRRGTYSERLRQALSQDEVFAKQVELAAAPGHQIHTDLTILGANRLRTKLMQAGILGLVMAAPPLVKAKPNP
jgi:hypothetical protein